MLVEYIVGADLLFVCPGSYFLFWDLDTIPGPAE